MRYGGMQEAGSMQRQRKPTVSKSAQRILKLKELIIGLLIQMLHRGGLLFFGEIRLERKSINPPEFH